MECSKQVDRSHYNFEKYMTKARWCSIWHQLDEIQKLKPSSILEVGPGSGILKAIGKVYGFAIDTLDLDPEIEPDHIGSATKMPFDDHTYDVVCSFQMLEHLPYESSLQAFSEMVRVCRKNVVISLPDSKVMLRYQYYLPRLGSYDFIVPYFRNKPKEHIFDGEHYWEINKKNFPLSKVISDLTVYAKLIDTYVVRENPYHRFFIFERTSV